MDDSRYHGCVDYEGLPWCKAQVQLSSTHCNWNQSKHLHHIFVVSAVLFMLVVCLLSVWQGGSKRVTCDLAKCPLWCVEWGCSCQGMSDCFLVKLLPLLNFFWHVFSALLWVVCVCCFITQCALHVLSTLTAHSPRVLSQVNHRVTWGKIPDNSDSPLQKW